MSRVETPGFANAYADEAYAGAYATLQFPNTYYLAFRDLPALIERHVRGRRAVDFGCGAGRSTRFLRQLGFEAVGVDIAADMIRQAHRIDPGGDYRQVERHGLSALGRGRYDLVLSAFTFDNVPTREEKLALFAELRELLAPDGRIVNLVSSPEMYTHEWASFSTKDYPENRSARSGDVVRIVITDIPDARPVQDVFWTDEAYRDIYRAASLDVLERHRPLALESEPYPWINETQVPPWTLYALGSVSP
jgi:SAM-dependent methyltransferase